MIGVVEIKRYGRIIGQTLPTRALSRVGTRTSRNPPRRYIPDARVGSSDTGRTGQGLHVQVRRAPASLVLREIHSVSPEVVSGMKPESSSVPDDYCTECENPDENQEEEPDEARHNNSLGGHSPSGGSMSGLYW